MHTALALPFAVLVTSSLFLGDSAGAGGSRLGVRLLRPRRVPAVVLPLALPGVAATAIFAFVISWNEVFAASVLTVRNRTLTAYLLSVLSESPLHAQFAGGFLLIMPSVLFIFLVRSICSHAGEFQQMMSCAPWLRSSSTSCRQELRRGSRAGERGAARRAMANSWPCWPVRLRQDHAAAHHRGAGDADQRARADRRARCFGSCRRAARGLAMVFQNYAVFPHMTVRDNVAFGLRMAGADAATDRRGRWGASAALLHIEPYLRSLSRRNFPADSASGSRSRARWRWSPRCC